MTAFRAGVAALATASLLLTGCQKAEPAGLAAPEPPASVAPASVAPASNGIEALTAELILDRAQQALAGAPSFQFSGYQMAGKLRVYAEFTAVGDDLIGMTRLGFENGLEKATAEILMVGGTQYMKPSTEYWKLLTENDDPQETIAAAGDKWIRIPSSPKTFGAVFGRDGLVADFDVPAGTVIKGAASEVDGVPVLTMGSTKQGGMSARVATSGEPYPIRWDTWAGDYVELTGIGAGYPKIEEPSADQVTDMRTVVEAARTAKA
ncbi:hypothetical protein FB565_006981 [Actinoplanes lutulentus]|uniref:hypothetical protein n=1 Tax=Actinoplanes lutulentus TaxID=1287878 RepID=UPI000DBA400F|nr:hypothetical protein [Actinoplanes lutulentus]MBB2947213.1 hypothetical protein [Actinoplanes lutulentus]